MEQVKKQTVFANGIIWRKRVEKTPEYVLGKAAIKVDEFVNFLQKHQNEGGWVSIELKKPREEGKNYYFTLDQFEPKKKEAEKTPEIPY